MMRNPHHSFTHYTLCFRCLPWQRTLDNSSESGKIRSICPKIPPLREFCTKIHPHLVHYFQNHRQRTPGNWSESTGFRAVHPQLPRITLFAESAPMTNNLGVNPENTANDANSAPIAQHISKSREIHDICTQQTR